MDGRVTNSNGPIISTPQFRGVARPVANLGNTCYMNAVLQTLAHAPELCMAMDCEPHSVTCPIALENRKKRRLSPSSSPEDGGNGDNNRRRQGTRKSLRSIRKSPPGDGAASVDDDEPKFCALCEIEWHLQEVHNSGAKDSAVTPTSFVNGFIQHVAPWFKLGHQEDSHEFLRLLIDAMQKSAKQARKNNSVEGAPEASETTKSEDSEYSFQLFHGMVESNVTCDSCQASSATMDPIEDVGLEVTAAQPTKSISLSYSESTALADVASAFQRFTRVEPLDSGYKCEKCGKVGKATKQSRLASIPPILTLHLKRFRYGDTRGPSSGGSGGMSNRRTSKSGSAKIEGHIKFEQFFDLKPYLTEDLQAKHPNMWCRLFAVIVHAGKNSHSGHYIAYVRNVNKNEWWKMDDARVTMASLQEVMSAEAYMLFYRVVEHPFAVALKDRSKKLQEQEQAVEEAAPKSENTAQAASAPKAEKVAQKVEKEERKPDREATDPAVKSEPAVSVAEEPTSEKKTATTNSRKRPVPAEFTTGKSWARARTRLPPKCYSTLRKAEELISENVQFKPSFFKLINDEATKGGAKVGGGPSTAVTENDVFGGVDKFSGGLTELIFRLFKAAETEEKESMFLSTTTNGNKGNGLEVNLFGVVEAGDEGLL